MYILRLDDMSEYRDIEKWNRMESLLNKYDIKPIFGIIPDNRDPSLIQFQKDDDFWGRVSKWNDEGWTPALHGYQHVFSTRVGGVNPVNDYSEFAGLSLEEQEEKIRNAYMIMIHHGIDPKIFFAPAHTYDQNTLQALKKETKIRVISDTVANNLYYEDEFYYIPQQAGHVRSLPLKVVTFCYHPNIMSDKDFSELEEFIKKNKFGSFDELLLRKRNKRLFDRLLGTAYFTMRKVRRKIRAH
ncbi:MAG: DUF2334 domain-containing protein [Lachnospiraceae bacterium]|nr:DUF2334 domain-containing protein [Lachnospiraceae bacterium]